MEIRGRRSILLPVAVGTLVVLLAILATLQYRWIQQLSEADRQRRATSLAAAAERFTEDFDREITRAFFSFNLDPTAPRKDLAGALGKGFEAWLDTASYPGLISDVLVLERGSEGDVEVQRFDPETIELRLVSPPRTFETILRRLEDHRGERLGGPILEEIPALVTFAGRPFRRLTLVVVVLDKSLIEQTIFPDLTERHFPSGDGLAVDAAVLRRQAPEEQVFASDRSLGAEYFSTHDASAGLLSLRRFPELPISRAPRTTGLGSRRGFEDRRLRRSAFAALDPGGRWVLRVRHRAGSLEAAVASLRRRNFTIGLGILALLAASIGMLAASALRARRLAHQQLEFVAGVTHELHTPLAAIRSAAQNLADGVIRDESRIRQYGTLIEDQGRRLSKMVAQALEYAGMRSGQKTYPRQPVELPVLISGAVEDCRWLADEREATVDRIVEDSLPPVIADPDALQRALHNLIENALKYGGEKPRVTIRAEHLAAAGSVRVSVEDSGSGVHPQDLPRIFEPFFRGRRSRSVPPKGGTAVSRVEPASTPSRRSAEIDAGPPIAGSGLGLSLVKHIVEAHDGRIEVESSDPGARFSIYLPATPPLESRGRLQPETGS